MHQTQVICTITADVLVLTRLPNGQIVWLRRRVIRTARMAK